jgi:hypothetical protein
LKKEKTKLHTLRSVRRTLRGKDSWLQRHLHRRCVIALKARGSYYKTAALIFNVSALELRFAGAATVALHVSALALGVAM